MKLTPAKIAFNHVVGVDNGSDDFDLLPTETQKRWYEAINLAKNFSTDYCDKCGQLWVDHEFGVPFPNCP